MSKALEMKKLTDDAWRVEVSDYYYNQLIINIEDKAKHGYSQHSFRLVGKERLFFVSLKNKLKADGFTVSNNFNNHSEGYDFQVTW